jgi:P27 family predicted phage terminase small subunit
VSADRSTKPVQRFAPKPPSGLKAAGKRLWRAIIGDLEAGWALDRRELHLLERASRCEDEMRDLEAAVDRDGPTATGSKGQVVVHPAVLECRQLRLTQLRLLAALELEDPDARGTRATPASKRARRAARARWGPERS